MKNLKITFLGLLVLIIYTLNTNAQQVYVEGSTTSTQNTVDAMVNYSGNVDIFAVRGSSVTAPGWGYGGGFTGGYMGVFGQNLATSYTGTSYGGYFSSNGTAGTRYGIYATATSSGNSNYGVYGSATGTSTGNNYGVYGIAFNSTGNNYAGYFDGKVHIKQADDSPNNGNSGLIFERDGDTENWEIGHASTDNFWFSRQNSLNAWLSATDGMWNTSDRSLKKDIKRINNALDKVSLLKPSTFIYKKDKNNRTTVGFVAQEVKEVFPNLVIEEGGINTLNYGHYGVLAIAAIQELNTKLDEKVQENTELQSKVSDLETRLAAIEAMLANQDAISNKEAVVETIEAAPTNAAKLGQNNPNPFYHKTIIEYNIPETAKNVTLQLTTTDGKVVKQYDIDARGLGNTTINGNELPAGTYLYSLVIDGQVSQTKQMVLTK